MSIEATTGRDRVIAHLLSRPVLPSHALLYMGERVDASWPPEALLSLVVESVEREKAATQRSLESLSSFGSFRGLR